MGSDLVWLLVGLAGLVLGAELLVRGGARLAALLGISPILVGLTVVSIGTSVPELAVGIRSAADGNGSLAVGNIAGTNILNLLFILGLSALMRPLALQMRTLKLDLPMMSAAAVLLWVMAFNGVLSRAEGVVLVVCSIAYTAVVIYSARSETPDVRAEFAGEYAEPARSAERSGLVRATALRNVGLLIAGIAIVVIGADWLVDGAVGIARGFGVSDAFIGLTVVAIGTSAPELVTTVVSTLRNERDIAVGNLLGSSIYNILLILGITVLATGDGLPLEHDLVRIDIPVMAAVALACIPVFITGRRVSRVEGAAFIAAYFGYLVVLLSMHA